MPPYIDMNKRARITENFVSKLPNPQVIGWHLAEKTTSGDPKFSIGLFKGHEWIRPGSVAQSEAYGYKHLIEKFVKMHQVLKIPISRFRLMGSMTFKDEKMRDDMRQRIGFLEGLSNISSNNGGVRTQ